MSSSLKKAQKRYENSLEGDNLNPKDIFLGNALWATIKEFQRIVYKEIGKRFYNSTPIYVSIERFYEELQILMNLLKIHYTKKVE